MFWLGKSITAEKKKGGKKTIEASLSPIEVLILAQLRSRQLRNNDQDVGQYGYEMIKELNDIFAGSWEAKSGTIYPILSKLQSKKGMLESYRMKSELGPVKNVYNLTEKGRSTIDQIIEQNFETDVNFILNYVDLLTPFLDEELWTREEREDIFELITSIPARAATIAMSKSVTEVDRKLRNEKLTHLKAKLEIILRNIEEQLEN
jgi:DNA-binding PadR family transcriptional regulator